MLAAKIIKGGAGVWGTTEMAAHPQISVEDAKKMVEYVLSLGEDRVSKKLPLSGAAMPGKEEDGAYILTATYHDKGTDGIPSLSSTDAIALRSNKLTAGQADELRNARKVNRDGKSSLDNIRHNSHAVYKNLDLTGVKRVTLMGFLRDGNRDLGGDIELRLDKAEGELIAKGSIIREGQSSIPVKIESITGHHDLYVVFKNPEAIDKSMLYFQGILVENK